MSGRFIRTACAVMGFLLLSGCDDQSQSKSEQSAMPPPIAGSSARVTQAPTPTPANADVPVGSGFDFYVLSLSWSPSYCEAEGERANRQQCGSGRPYAFVVHGLWPQFERGYPSDCAPDGPDLDERIARSMTDLMPSFGLVRHEWSEHGTCSGLDATDYFRVLRRARELVVVPQEFRLLKDYRVVAPDDVEAAFQEANPSLPPDGIAIDCDRRFLREVRICMTKSLGFTACPDVDRRSCRSEKVVMPPVRGG